MTGKQFSIILPVCHGGAFLEAAIASLKGIDFPAEALEVVVAISREDERSKSFLVREAGSFPFPLIVVDSPGPLRSRLLNQACDRASGRVLVFIDDDCTVLPDWLRKYDDVLARFPGAGIVGGSDELVAPLRSPFCLALDAVLNSCLGTGGVRKGRGMGAGGYSPKLWNMAVARDVARQVAINGRYFFDETLKVHEDVELTNRIRKTGRQVVCVPEIRVLHARESTFTSFAVRNFQMASVCRRFGIQRGPHRLLSLLTGTALSALLAFPVLPAWGRIGFLSLLGGYLLLLSTGAWKGLCRTGSVPAAGLIPCLMVTLHIARGIGYVWPAAGGRDHGAKGF